MNNNGPNLLILYGQQFLQVYINIFHENRFIFEIL